MTILFSIDAIIDAITDNRIILTANNRQRNQILQAYNQLQVHKTSDMSSWRKPIILTLQQWVNKQWQNLCFEEPSTAHQSIADTWQRTLLWEQAITKTAIATTLLQSKQMANMADTALNTLANWQYDIEQLGACQNENSDSLNNTQIFLKWLLHFQEGLKKANLITEEGVRTILINAFNESILTPQENVLLYGFDEFPPLTQTLLRTALPEYKLLKPTPAKGLTTRRTSADSETDEMRAAALWVSEILATNPSAMIGIIIPELGQVRDKIERVFSEVFEPLMFETSTPRYTPALNFSAGLPLGQTPIIFTALELLALHNSKFSTDRICNLLQNNFWNNHIESDEKNRSINVIFKTALITKLRDLNIQQISSSELRSQAQQLSEMMPEVNQTLNKKLQLAAQISLHRTKKYSINTWLDKVNTLLEQLGWPGERRLDSLEYQQLTLWYQLQESLLRVDCVQAMFTFSETITLLKNSANKMHFQPQTTSSPVQILGALEGAGLNFTHCWIMGMHNRQWPNLPRPNPLLPYDIQRQFNMPHASAVRELEYAERLTEGYKTCANEVVFSYASSEDGESLSPSHLISDIVFTPLNHILTKPAQTTQQLNYLNIKNSQVLEPINCSYGPIITKTQVKGGAGLFKDQSICPFTAFAKRRLGAQNPLTPSNGFSAIERGNMLHEALADVWDELYDQSTLIDMNKDTLSLLITSACDMTVKKLQKKRGPTLGNRLCQIETERLYQQVSLWLEIEKKRNDFTIEAIEQKRSVTFAGLEFDLRVDRIDKLPSGKLLIIDYKTGESSPNSWKNESFTEPQLPLYACTLGGESSAIAFVVINANKQSMQGWEDETHYLGLNKPEKENWEGQCEQWGSTLTRLAESFIKGYSAVEYIHNKYQDYDAHLNGLTRILEMDAVQLYARKMQRKVS